MIVAMDFHGSLAAFPALRELARAVLAGGGEVHVVSAVNCLDPNAGAYRERINSWGVPFTGVHFVHFDGPPTPEVAYRVGMQKVGVMRGIGATILFDDNPDIVRAVKDSGLLACHLRGNTVEPP